MQRYRGKFVSETVHSISVYTGVGTSTNFCLPFCELTEPKHCHEGAVIIWIALMALSTVDDDNTFGFLTEFIGGRRRP